MSRPYYQNPGYLDRQPSWDVVEVEPSEIESRGPPQVYYDPPRPSSPIRVFQYEERPRYGSISNPKSVSPVRNARDNTGRVRFKTQSRRPRLMRSRSRDSEEWALNDQLRQSEKEHRLDREINDLHAEIRAKERVRRLNRDQDGASGFTPSQSGGLSRAQGYYPHRNFMSPDSVAGSTLGARRNSIAVQVQSEHSSDSNVGESDNEESDTESSSSFGFGIPGSQNHRPSQNGDHNHDPNTIPPKLQGSVEGMMAQGANPIENMTMHRIIRSQFSSLGEGGEEMKIELNTGQGDRLELEATPGPLFRWIHLKGEAMDFDDFIEVAIQSPELTSSEKGIIKQHLRRLRNQTEKPLVTPVGYQGRYMEPTMIQELNLQPATSKSHLDTSVIALCLPYFLLDEYSSNSEAPKSAKHPTRTLLQSSISTTAQERDMRQAVCKLSVKQTGYCFHVSQLWCLILNDKLMVTCARLDWTELGRDSIAIRGKPTPAYPHIQVSDGGNCLWQIGLDQCQTWFAFTANFMEIKSSSDGFMSRFEDQFRVMMKGKTVTAKDWSRILSIAQNSTVRLFLYRKKPSKSSYILTENVGEEGDGSSSESENMFPWQMERPPPPPDLAGSHSFEPSIKNETLSRNSSVPNGPQIIVDGLKSEPEPTSINNFHVFSWLSRQSSALEAVDNLHKAEEKEDAIDEKKIKADLDAIHQILSKNTNQKEMKAYQDCREKRLPEVVKLLALVTQVNGQLTPGISIIDKFFIAATDMYELFIPLDIETKVGFRYWGAVHCILKKKIPHDQPSLIKSIEKFILVARLAKIIKEELSGTRGPKPEHAELPEEFQTAWLHCIVYLVLFRVRVKNVRDRDRHIEKCQLLLYRGRQNLARKLGKMRLEKKEVAVPQVVLSVLIFRLLKDVTPDPGQLDLYRTYWEYWDQLEAEVQTHRIERAQPEISDLRQEITAVTKALDNQLSVLDALRKGFLSQRAGWSYLNNGDRKHEVSVIKECISHVENRIKGFEEMGFRANELESWNTQKIASTKDRQDKAIYAFTIVTIIFLPLSFVSGFLGMNTTDIRNSNSKQWVFWASGLPLTAVVILVALLWAGELGNAWRAAVNLFPTQKRGSGYMRIRDQQKKWCGSSTKKTKPYLPSSPSLIPLQPPRLPTQEPWDKPYRRTETYKSTA